MQTQLLWEMARSSEGGVGGMLIWVCQYLQRDFLFMGNRAEAWSLPVSLPASNNLITLTKRPHSLPQAFDSGLSLPPSR